MVSSANGDANPSLRQTRCSRLFAIALTHAINSKVEAAYRRGDLFEKRGLLMTEWGRFCAPNERGNGRVVSINRRG